MAELSNHVSITISEATVGIARAGFGTILILSHKSLFSERLRYYTSLAGISGDGFATSSPEYRAARAIFSQSPHPERIAIGRAASAVTQVYVTSVSSVRNSFAYKMNVKGEGFTDAAITFTSDGTATNDEIAAGLVTALNAVVGKNYTAATTGSAGSLVVTTTGNAAGNWFSLEVVDVTALSNRQTHTDPGITADLDAITVEQPDWYGLYTVFNSNAYVLAAAAWAEAQIKIYAADVCETLAITTTAAAGNDTLEDLLDLAYGRTFGSYHPDPSSMFGAAWMGRTLPIDPGGESWKFKRLAGVNPVILTPTHRTNLTDRKANSYETVAGINVTFNGTTADGDFIDITRGLDWLRDDMQKEVFGALAGVDKVPYTNAGIAIIEAGMRGSLQRGVSRGVLSGEDDEPQVDVPLVEEVSASDRALRNLPNCNFTGRMAGAIHKVFINGTVTF